MTSRVDHILNLLDNATQHTDEYNAPVNRTVCWRCQGPPGDGPSGVCNGCRSVLLGDIEDHEGEPLVAAESVDFSELAELGEAIRRRFPGQWRVA